MGSENRTDDLEKEKNFLPLTKFEPRNVHHIA